MLFLFLWCQFIWFFFQNYLKRVIIVNRGVISLVWPIFFMFGQPKPKIWVLKFSTKIDQIIGNQSVLVLFRFCLVWKGSKKTQKSEVCPFEVLEYAMWNKEIWVKYCKRRCPSKPNGTLMIYIKDRERKEKNHTMRKEETDMWSGSGGWRMEAGGKCGLN